MEAKKQEVMHEIIRVDMKEQELFDFMLFHTYSGFAGFLTNVLGAAVIFMGIIMMVMGRIALSNLVFYILAGIAFLGYTPLLLRYRARKQIKLSPEYKGTQTYEFGENGICVENPVGKQEISWKEIKKVVATPKTIGYYYEESKAIIIPKHAFGERFMPVMKIVFAFVPRECVKIR